MLEVSTPSAAPWRLTVVCFIPSDTAASFATNATTRRGPNCGSARQWIRYPPLSAYARGAMKGADIAFRTCRSTAASAQASLRWSATTYDACWGGSK
eukprot:3610923-Rhodomonas_salina.4